MPLSQIWMVVPSRESSPAARASTAMTAEGWISLTKAAIISALSMPVWPKTPGAMTAEGRSLGKEGGMASGGMWRVAKSSRDTSGPKASGVMAELPSPTVSTGPSSGRSRAIRAAAASAWAGRSGAAWEKGGQRRV